MSDIPAEAVDLIKRFEGFRARAYRCPAGYLTIGFGTRRGVTLDMTITRESAECLVYRDLGEIAALARPMIDVELKPHQWAALLSWLYNVGCSAFARSTLRKLVNAGRFDDVPAELAKWKRAGGRVLTGLVRRRAAEGALWSS